MANIKKIELTDVKRYSGTDWINLKQKGATVKDITSIVLYSDGTGFTPASKAITLDWTNFTDGAEVALTIFGTDTGLIAAGTKSIRIRYKIKTTSAGSPDTEVTSADYFYQLINFAVPTTGTLSGLPATQTTSTNVTITVNVPAFTNDMVASAANIQTLLTNTESWALKWVKPDSSYAEYTPSSATLGSPVATSTTEFGGFLVPVYLTYRLPVSTSGNYTLTVYFYPNDGGTRILLPQSLTCTATVTVNMATQTATTLYSADGSVSMSIGFTE